MALSTAHEASSSSSKSFRYDYQVFLSFRGEDTRKTFTDHLYTALVDAGLRTFRDNDEIERGKKLDLELRKAIQQSRISIIVFSKNYASSTWCLDEVLMIHEWSKIGGNEILPVFYNVDPSDVRKQRGSFGDAFSLHERKFSNGGEISDEIREKWVQKVKKWRVALEQVANLTGMVLENEVDGHEAKFVREIVNVVRRKLNRKVLHVGHHLVGMAFRVQNIDSWVKNNSSREHIIVISGMGGIGKTTIAKHVYNLNYIHFEKSCFLASVKEESEHSHGLVNLQMQLLSSILSGKQEQIYNVDEGITKINEAISCKRILIVIDDVDDVKQLDALLGIREFYPGCKIIITTRNKSLLKAHEVHKLHVVDGLSKHDSFVLFCWHAFGKEKPAEGYEELSKRAIYQCVGLPLAHKVFGSSLAGKSKVVWESTLEKLEANFDTEIVNVLKISFLSLKEDSEKNLFLHIACFFVGHDKDETIAILDECGFFTVHGFQILIDRCLISIDENNKLVMHQLLQKTGQKIVDEESQKEPGKRSRVWRSRDSYTVLKENKGTEIIEGLVLDMKMYKDDAFNVRKGNKGQDDELCDMFSPSNQGSWLRNLYSNFLSSEPSSDVNCNYDSFSRMSNLTLLALNYTKLTGCIEKFPQGLRWLCWHGFSLKSIPFKLPLQNIVSLDMSYSKLEYVWDENRNKDLWTLKFLNLSHSRNLIKTPNFNGLWNLEKLILNGCVSLIDVCDTISGLKKLALLDLGNCKSLKRFPNIDMLTSLQSCSDTISELLKKVDANGVTGIPSPDTIKDEVYAFLQPLVSKPTLRNPQLKFSFPHSLVSLNLSDCNLSNDLDLSRLSLLRNLDLSYNPLLDLPESIGSLAMLEMIHLNSCSKLRAISSLPENISLVDVYDCRSLERITYPSGSVNKHKVDSFNCLKLVEVQDMFKWEPLDTVNRAVLDLLGLRDMKLITSLKMLYTTYHRRTVYLEESIRQGLYEFGIFTTFLRLDEIPRWCIDGSNNGSSSVSFVVPSHRSGKVLSLNVYCVYKLRDNVEKDSYLNYLYYQLFIKISNKTKGLSWLYNPLVVGVPGNEEEELVWLSHWKWSQLETGDKVDVLVLGTDIFDIKEFGIQFVWDENEEVEMNGRHNHQDNNGKDVIGGDLSSFEYQNTGNFILDHNFISRKPFAADIEQPDSQYWVMTHTDAPRILYWRHYQSSSSIFYPNFHLNPKPN